MSLAEELMEQASHLAGRERTRPRVASLRRSVSASYYALVHLLTADAVQSILPRLTNPATHQVQRWFDHSEMKKVCGIFSKKPLTRQFQGLLPNGQSADLLTVARVFVELQDARHQADYDLGTSWTRVTVQQYLRSTKDAFEAWNRVRRTPEAGVFALALLSSKLFERER